MFAKKCLSRSKNAALSSLHRKERQALFVRKQCLLLYTANEGGLFLFESSAFPLCTLQHRLSLWRCGLLLSSVLCPAAGDGRRRAAAASMEWVITRTRRTKTTRTIKRWRAAAGGGGHGGADEKVSREVGVQIWVEEHLDERLCSQHHTAEASGTRIVYICFVDYRLVDELQHHKQKHQFLAKGCKRRCVQ